MPGRLECELCGGKLIGKPGGIFECESCGTQYSKEWAQAKVQEIKGTVQVEGIVQVEGAVKVEGLANKEALLKRGWMALHDGKQEEARTFFDQALNSDAECAEAYLGIWMSKHSGLTDREAFATWYTKQELLPLDVDLSRAKDFAVGELATWFQALEETRQTSVSQDAKERAEVTELLAGTRKRIAPAQNLIAIGWDFIAGVKLDGTVLVSGKDKYVSKSVSDWYNIVAVAAGRSHLVGLRSDGTVVATGSSMDGQCDVSSWRDIIAIAASDSHSVGLRADGTVVSTNKVNKYGISQHRDLNEVSYWHDVIEVAAGPSYTVGRQSDGTIRTTGGRTENRQDIVSISSHTWLKSDGTIELSYVGAPGGDLRNLVAVTGFSSMLVGLKYDGTLQICANPPQPFLEEGISAWRDIVAVACHSSGAVVGIKTNGTVVTAGGYVGFQYFDLNEVCSWKLFDSIDALGADRKAMSQISQQ